LIGGTGRAARVQWVPMADIADLTAVDLLRLYRRRELSPV
jgi:hypothetical protein